MLKSPIIAWLFATTFVFSAWLNVVHGYEHDEHEQHEQHSHDEQEQHSEECDTCIILSKLSDPIHFVPDSYKGRFIAEQNYFFILKNNFTTATTIVNPRAPPQVNLPT